MPTNSQISIRALASGAKGLGFIPALGLGLATTLSVWTTSAATLAFADYLGKQESAVRTPFRLQSGTATVSAVSDAALSAGVVVGSTVRAVNGEELLGLAVLNRALSSSRAGDVLVLEIEDGSEEFTASIPLEGREWNFGTAALETFVQVVLPFACMLVGLKAVWLRPRSVLGWLTFGLLVGIGNQFYVPEVRPIDTFASLLQTGYIQFIRHSWFACILLFAIYFPARTTLDRKQPYMKWILVAPLFLQAGLLAATNVSELVDFALAQALYGNGDILPDLVHQVVSHLPELALFLALAILATRYWVEDSHDERRRLRLFWLGTVVSLGPAIFLTVVAEATGIGFDNVPLWLLFLSILPAIVFPGVIRHVVLVESATDVVVKLREILERSIEPRRLHLVRTLAGTIAIVCFLIWLISGTAAAQASLYLAATAASLVAVCHPLVVKHLRYWIDARLFSEHYRIEASLVDLEHKIALDQDLQTLPERVCRELASILSTDTVCLVQGDTNGGPLHVTQSTNQRLRGREIPGAAKIIEGLRGGAGVLQLDYQRRGQAARHLRSEGRGAAETLRSRLLVALSDRPGIRGFVSCGPRPLEAPYTETESRLVASVSSGLSMALRMLVLIDSVSQESAARERIAIEKASAEQASKAKGEFLASMSHELRTPLGAILGYSELLQEDAEEAGNLELRSDLAKIQSAGEHLLNIIDSVLDLSRIEAGRMELHLESFRVSVLVADIQAIMLPLATKNGNRFVVSCPHDTLILESDRMKLRQCLINLLGNACKFTKEGTVSLAISKDGDEIQFTVADTGIGMTSSQIDKLFKAFSQVHEPKSGIHGGTGLGLVISKQFAQILGGDIDVQSEQGAGTIFRLTVPVRSGARRTFSLRNAAVPKDGAMVVLVIDDDPTVHEVMGRSLAGIGFRTLHSMDGDEGLQMARQERPDAILLDILMANTDGWRVMMELKEGVGTANIPIVISSVLDRDEGDPSAIADGYLRKPVSRDQLVQTIRNHCRERSSTPKLTVVVVVDDEETRSVICRLLKSQGREVLEFASARDALAVLSERCVDLVLTDLMQHGTDMDGFDFIGELRRSEAMARIPIVVVTSKDLSAQEKQRLNDAATAILEKAADWQDRLADQIRNAAETRRI